MRFAGISSSLEKESHFSRFSLPHGTAENSDTSRANEAGPGYNVRVPFFFSIDEILRERLASGRAYLEFLRVPALSPGVYVLKAGTTDAQQPHAEDEIYFIVSGAARMSIRQANGEALDRPVSAGDLIFVPARQEHRFHSIAEDLVALVIFAPAET